MALQKDHITETEQSAPPKRRGRLLRRVLIGLLFVLIFIIIALVIVWVNRYAIFEQAIIRNLEGRGLQAELNLDDYDGQNARLSDIHIRHQGETVLKAKRLSVSFDFDELLEGKVQSVNVLDGYAKLELDENFRLISDWIPQGEGGGGFPRDGVSFDDITADILTPHGNLSVKGSGQMLSTEELIADIEAQTEQFRGIETIDGYNADELVLSGTISRDGQSFTGESVDIRARQLGISGLELAGLTSRSDFTLNLTTPTDFTVDARTNLSISRVQSDVFTGGVNASYNGNIRRSGERDIALSGQSGLTFDGFTVQQYSARSGAVRYDGDISFTDGLLSFADGLLDFNLTDFNLGPPGTARDLATTLTAGNTTASVPLAQHFVPVLRDDLEALLEIFSADGQAKISADKETLTVTLTEETDLYSPRKRVSLNPTQEPFLDWSEGELKSNIDGRFNGQWITDVDLQLSGPATRSLFWNSVNTLNADISLPNGWITEEATLSNMRASLNLSRKNDAPMRASVTIPASRPLTFSGPIFGAKAEAFTVAGRVISQGNNVVFNASAPITIDSLDPGGEWRIENVRLSPSPGRADSPYTFRTSGGKMELAESLGDIELTVIDRTGARKLDASAAQIDITGLIDEKTKTQKLTLLSKDARLFGANWPTEEMLGTAQNADVIFSRTGNQPWQYSVESDGVDLRAKPVTMSKMALDLSGQGANVTLGYSGGTVALDGSGLPPAPVKGEARYQNGSVTGEAQTYLPKASAFPIYADYRYENGRGVADITVPRFVFSPNGVQPATYVPALKGKVADVKGLASATAKITYVQGQPIDSEGTISLREVDLGTLVGPFTGIDTDLTFSSLFPLVTDGEQTLTMTSFDPGIPLPNGTVKFSVIENGFELIDANWPLDPGYIRVQPTVWRTDERVNEVTVGIEGVSLGLLAARISNGKVIATGEMTGLLPIVIDGVNVRVKGGRVEIENGGTIRMDIADFEDKLQDSAAGRLLADFLRNFSYEKLYIEADGPLDGDLTLGMEFTAQNQDVLDGLPFKFRVNIEGELVNISRNLIKAFKGEDIQSIIERTAR